MFTITFLTLVLAADPEAVPFGALKAMPPKEWVVQKPKYTLRSHQFQLKSEVEGLADAEVIVSPQSKPDPEKVFPGWRAQYVPPDGKTAADHGTVSKFEAGSATVHMLDVHGTWKYNERPFDKKSIEVMKEDHRTVWAIIVVKDEASHVRLSGPKKIVDAYYDGFEKWLKSMK
jgi:hypothetical protein